MESSISIQQPAPPIEQNLWTGAQIQELLDTKVRYKDWKFVVEQEDVMRSGMWDIDLHLRVQWTAPDNVTGAPEVQKSRWWRLSKHMTLTEIINTAFACCQMAEKHEFRETFNYKLGDQWTMPYNTHTYIEALAAASPIVDLRVDTRPDAPANQRRE
jgi:hypothetical protein